MSRYHYQLRGYVPSVFKLGLRGYTSFMSPRTPHATHPILDLPCTTSECKGRVAVLLRSMPGSVLLEHSLLEMEISAFALLACCERGTPGGRGILRPLADLLYYRSRQTTTAPAIRPAESRLAIPLAVRLLVTVLACQ